MFRSLGLQLPSPLSISVFYLVFNFEQYFLNPNTAKGRFRLQGFGQIRLGAHGRKFSFLRKEILIIISVSNFSVILRTIENNLEGNFLNNFVILFETFVFIRRCENKYWLLIIQFFFLSITILIKANYV